jgi:hypothetical protein
MNATTACGVKGCKRPARWAATKLYGDRKTLRLCDGCRPNGNGIEPGKEGENRWYRVRSIEGT